MIPNNNFSVLPWYTSIEQQNARKWWVYNRVYPLFVPAGFLPSFQIIYEKVNIVDPLFIRLYKADGTLVGDYKDEIIGTGLRVEARPGYTIVVYPGTSPFLPALENGQYYLSLQLYSREVRYSEIFTVVNDIQPYMKIEWWDVEDFYMDAGVIIYKFANNTQFRNILYLQADIAKPEYIFEEEGETRDGYFFPIKQISEKRYRFAFLASEYLLDVMRFIRMADYARIEKNDQIYNLDTFLITPEWEGNGDVAAVEAEFDTATVAKKIGRGYIQPVGKGDFNDDFNDDFKNM